MCKAIEELCEEASAKAFEQGIEQGIEKKAIEMAQKALQAKMMSPEQVADFVGLSLEKVLSLC